MSYSAKKSRWLHSRHDSALQLTRTHNHSNSVNNEETLDKENNEEEEVSALQFHYIPKRFRRNSTQKSSSLSLLRT